MWDQAMGGNEDWGRLLRMEFAERTIWEQESLREQCLQSDADITCCLQGRSTYRCDYSSSWRALTVFLTQTRTHTHTEPLSRLPTTHRLVCAGQWVLLQRLQLGTLTEEGDKHQNKLLTLFEENTSTEADCVFAEAQVEAPHPVQGHKCNPAGESHVKGYGFAGECARNARACP